MSRSMFNKLLGKNPDGSFVVPVNRGAELKIAEERIKKLVQGTLSYWKSENTNIFEEMDVLVTLQGAVNQANAQSIGSLQNKLKEYANREQQKDSGEENKK